MEQALPIFVQICFGLAYAHDANQKVDATLKILDIAKSWTKLSALEIHNIPVTPTIVEALNAMPHLRHSSNFN
jgi:hypothetical protein